MKKRAITACVASIILVLGNFSLYADNTKSSKNRGSHSSHGSHAKEGCNRFITKSKECIEKSVAHELKKFRCALFELFSEQNAFFSNKTELLGLHLKEEISTKDKASTLLFKDFLLKRLQAMEHQLGLFVDGEFSTLKDMICHKTQEMDCELKNILCQTQEVNGEIKCIISMFSSYLNALSNYYAEINPPFAEILHVLAETTTECAVEVDCGS